MKVKSARPAASSRPHGHRKNARRGEARASIGAVSRREILARTAGAADAARVELNHSTRELSGAEAVPATFGHFLGSPHGTRIRSEGLFSQIPARLKFLKSAASELSLIREGMERLALSHPSVGFRLQNEDRTVLQLRPQSEEERIRAIVADGEDYPIRRIEIEHGPGLRLTAWWVQGMSLPHSRSLIQLVNGRVLRDRVLQQAMTPGDLVLFLTYLKTAMKPLRDIAK